MLELIDALTSSPDERRRKPRFQTTFGTTCLLTDSRQHGLVWDISNEGLGLLLAHAPTAGEILPVQLETDVVRSKLSIPIQVAHVRPLSTGDYFVGARFVRPLTAEEIEPFVTPVLGRPHLTIDTGSKKAGPKGKPRAAKAKIGK